jgi:phosphomannomutase
VLTAARGARGIGALGRAQPARFTMADRLAGIPTEASATLVGALVEDSGRLARLLGQLGEDYATRDLCDGLRVICASRRIVHIRPSGNAPELRLYVETEDPATARVLLDRLRAAVSAEFA